MRSRALLVLAVLACATGAVAAPLASGEQPAGAVATCAAQSTASFPGAFTSAGNLVVGPLVLVGARRPTTAEAVQRFGGMKYPALVAAEHRVTIELSRQARRFASLAYGPSAHAGDRTVAHGHRVVTFRSCGKGRAGSDAGGRPVTFWSGFVLADGPHCLRLRVWVDGASRPRVAKIPLGRPC